MISVEEHKPIVRRYIEAGWSKGDMEVVTGSVAPKYRRPQPNMTMSMESDEGADDADRRLPDRRSDRHIAIEHLVAEGDWVVTHVRCTGTRTGELAGIPSSGRTVHFHRLGHPPDGGRADRRKLRTTSTTSDGRSR